MAIDKDRTFAPLRIAILTVSDTRTEEDDKSGGYLESAVLDAGHTLVAKIICKDDVGSIEGQLNQWVASSSIDVVLTTGGTGITKRDVTPEAVHSVVTAHEGKLIPGFGELFRMLSYETISTSTIQSRCTAAVARATLIFALPGSTGACKDGWSKILVHQLDSRFRPCNFAELLDRL